MTARRLATAAIALGAAVLTAAPATAAPTAPAPAAATGGIAASAGVSSSLTLATRAGQTVPIDSPVIATGTLRTDAGGVAAAPVELWLRPYEGGTWRHVQNTRTNAAGAYAFAQRVSDEHLLQARFPGTTRLARSTSRATPVFPTLGTVAIAMRGCDIDAEGFPLRISSTIRMVPQARGTVLELRGGRRYDGVEIDSEPRTVGADGTASVVFVVPEEDRGETPFFDPYRWAPVSSAHQVADTPGFSAQDPDRSHRGDSTACFTMPIARSTSGG